LRSIRSFNRARTTERGFVLIAALTLAVLYFALMELLLLDSSRELAEARRFRARVVAGITADNAIELAAVQMVNSTGRTIEDSDEQGRMTGVFTRNGDAYELTGEGETTGAVSQKASVFVQGRIEPNGAIKIDYAMYGQ
jgi:hypothetical protein